MKPKTITIEEIENLDFTNIVRMNSNFGANVTQDRIKEELLKTLGEKLI
jgi:hypothetical protein